MLYKELTITSPDGLKSRPAALFVQVASKFSSQILIESENRKVNLSIFWLTARTSRKL